MSLVVVDRPPVPAPLLWTPNYSPAAVAPWGWTSRHVPSAPGLDASLGGVYGGTPQLDRLQVVNAPAPTLPFAPADGRALRCELRPYRATPGLDPPDGDVFDSSGYHTNRSEIYGLHRVPGNWDAATWPLGVNVDRRFVFSIYLAPDWVVETDSLKWVVLAQWKGYGSGSPPFALETKQGDLSFTSKRFGRRSLGPLPIGVWSEFDVRVRLSGFSDGWIEIYRDDQLVLPRTMGATMDRYFITSVGATVNIPVYWRMGNYRTSAFTTTAVSYYSAPKVY